MTATVIATVFLGIVASWIAVQQLRLARHRFRLDLFDRRYKIFDATRSFLSVILREATFKDSNLFEFYAGTSDTEFFFGPEIVAYLFDIRKRALDMRLSQKKYERLPVGEERSRLVDAEHQEAAWLNDQIVAITVVFRPYLSFSKIR